MANNSCRAILSSTLTAQTLKNLEHSMELMKEAQKNTERLLYMNSSYISMFTVITESLLQVLYTPILEHFLKKAA